MEDTGLPTRCFSCGKVLSEGRQFFNQLTEEDGFSEADALGEISMPRRCCRRMILTDSNVSSVYLGGSSKIKHISVAVPKKKKEKTIPQIIQKTTKEKPIGAIKHLEAFVPPQAPKEFVYPDDLILADDGGKKTSFDDRLPKPVYWKHRERLLTIVRFLTEVSIKYNENKDNQDLEKDDEDQNIDADQEKEEIIRILFIGASGLPLDVYRFIISLFPNFVFTLFDDGVKLFGENHNNLAKEKELRGKITFNKGPFNIDDHKKYLKNVDAFMSEQITANPSLGSNIYEQKYLQDLQIQATILASLQGKIIAALLYFRPILNVDTLKYVDGKIWLGPWKSSEDTMCHIFVNTDEKIKFVQYNREFYAQKMNFFQKDTRLKAYTYTIQKYDQIGLDPCYDCASEWNIWNQYIKLLNPSFTLQKRNSAIITKIKETNDVLDTNHIRSLINPPPRDQIQ